MTARVHPSAIVDDGAQLGEDVEIGPFAIIGPACLIGDRCVIAPHAMLQRNVKLGSGVRVGSGTILGGDPQDLKYRGEETWVEIGDRTVIREYTTIHRGTVESHRTVVGSDSFIMSYVHLGHDCRVGDRVILSNSVQLAGHVHVDDGAIVSGLTAVHQFTHIGRQAFVGGCSRVVKDVPPYLKAAGNPVRLYGLNSLGLQRTGFDTETLAALKTAYRLLFRSDLNISQALERARTELPDLPEMRQFLDFIESSERGIGF